MPDRECLGLSRLDLLKITSYYGAVQSKFFHTSSVSALVIAVIFSMQQRLLESGQTSLPYLSCFIEMDRSNANRAKVVCFVTPLQ